MAFVTVGAASWGSSPAIGMTFQVDKQRVGANMQYMVKCTVSAVTGASYFGYPIYLRVYVDGQAQSPVTLKNATPSRWVNPIIYTSGWITSANKTSGNSSISFNVYSGSGNTRNATYTYSVEVSPGVSGISASNGTLETAQTINITRYDSDFVDTVTYTCGSASGTIVSRTSSDSVSWTPPISLASQNASGNVVTITLKVTTYDGLTAIGSTTKAITAAIPVESVRPTASISVTDAEGYYSTYGAFVQGKSRAAITVSASGRYGATITGYSTTFDGATYGGASNTTPYIIGSGTLTARTTVTDSRGNTITATQNVTVLAYSMPRVTALSCIRCDSGGNADDQGAYMKVTYGATITSLNNRNTRSYVIRYKKSTAASYSTRTISSSLYTVSGSVIIAADTGSSYNVVFAVTDAFNSVTTATELSTAYTIFHISADGEGFAFGKVSEIAGAVEIHKTIYDLHGRKLGITSQEFGAGYGHILYENGLLIQWGTIAITPTAANVVTQAQVTYQRPYAYTPHIIGTPQNNVPQVITWGIGGGTTAAAALTGLVIYMTRSNINATNFRWLALGMEA